MWVISTPRSMFKLFCLLLGILIPTFLSAQTWQRRMDFDELQSYLGPSIPTGTNISVGQVEANPTTSVYLPQATAVDAPFAGSGIFSGTTFHPESGAGTQLGHANSVGNFYYGNTNSLIPNTPSVFCWGSGANPSLANNSYYSIIQSPNSIDDDVKTVSMALISLTSNLPNVNFFTRVLDWTADQENVLQFAGMNNGSSSAYPTLFINGYNTLSVGRADGAHSAGTVPSGVDGDGRRKPEIVCQSPAGSQATSWSTATAASVAGFLYDTAETLSVTAVSDHPEIVKALILAGATKNRFPSWNKTSSDPIDDTYGAGEINVFYSYMMLAEGEQSYTAPVNTIGWDWNDYNSTKSLFDPTLTTFDYEFTVPAAATSELSAFITWNSNVTRTVSESIDFTRDPLANLDLELLDSTGAQVQISNSSIYNLEHIYLKELAPGTYKLRVTTDTPNRDFAIAWRNTLSYDQEPSLVGISSSFELELVNLINGNQYFIERSSDLENWSELHRFNATTSSDSWTDPAPLSDPSVFYRLKRLSHE